jgi:L-threonine kinase
MQGFLPDASSFLVSGLPSRLFFSEAVLQPGGTPHILPPKARQALDLFLHTYAGNIEGCTIRLQSNIPPGKGLSSSSTDILSVLHVVNDYLQTDRSPDDLYRIAASVEPTDPCLSNDIVVFRQQEGIVDQCISLPPMTVLYFDAEPGRLINTLDVQRPWSAGAGQFFDWLLRRFLQAAETGDYVNLFDSITYSAEYNQTVIALPRFAEYYQLAQQTKSGLMVAHSGTIVGLLTRPELAAELLGRLQTATSEPIYSEPYTPYL